MHRHLFFTAVSAQVEQTAHGCRSSNDAGNHRAALCESHRGTTGSEGWVVVRLLSLFSSKMENHGPIGSMRANQQPFVFFWGLALTQLFKCVLTYGILLHLLASWLKLKWVFLPLRVSNVLLAVPGSLPAPAPCGRSQCSPSGHGHQYQHRGETSASGIWHMGSFSQVGRATDGGASLGGRDFEVFLLLDLIHPH